MPRITKKMLEEQAQKEALFQKNTNKCIALVTQKLNIIIGEGGYMYLVNSNMEDDGVGSTIPLILEGKKMKSTMVGLEIDPMTEIAFDPYNNHKIVTGLINLYLETYYPGIDIQSLSLAGRHLNELGNAVLKLTNGQEFKSGNYYKDTLKYLDILYQMDGSAPPEMRVLKEMDSDDRTRPTCK